MRAFLKPIVFLPAVFSLERGAEMMWPQESPWLWWGIAAVLITIWAGLQYGPALATWWTRRKHPEEPSMVVEESSQEQALWRDSLGAGRLVARAIQEADSLETAHDIFDAHYASPNRQDTPVAAVALAKRMVEADEDAYPFFVKMAQEGVDLDDEMRRLYEAGHDQYP